jgi:hypothetical protein
MSPRQLPTRTTCRATDTSDGNQSTSQDAGFGGWLGQRSCFTRQSANVLVTMQLMFPEGLCKWTSCAFERPARTGRGEPEAINAPRARAETKESRQLT